MTADYVTQGERVTRYGSRDDQVVKEKNEPSCLNRLCGMVAMTVGCCLSSQAMRINCGTWYKCNSRRVPSAVRTSMCVPDHTATTTTTRSGKSRLLTVRRSDQGTAVTVTNRLCLRLLSLTLHSYWWPFRLLRQATVGRTPQLRPTPAHMP